MKKLLAVVLALGMMLLSFGGIAEGLDLSGVEDPLICAEDLLLKDLSGNKSGMSTDKVTRTDNSVTILTNFGIEISLIIPADVLTLTQNYLLDMGTYNAVYSDPTGAVQDFMAEDVHLDFFTVDDGYDGFVYVYESDDIGAYIGDANSLTENDADMIAEFLQSQLDLPFSYGTLGNQVWFLGDALESDGYVWLFTWVNGCMVKVIVAVEDPAVVTDVLNVITGMTITAK